MSDYLMLALFLISCNAASKTYERPNLACVLDVIIDQLLLEDDYYLSVGEDYGWVDSISLIIVSAVDMKFLTQNDLTSFKTGRYRSRTIVYGFQSLDSLVPAKDVEHLALTTGPITWERIDTTGVPNYVDMPPYNPPSIQIPYNYVKRKLEPAIHGVWVSAVGVCGE